MRLILDFFFSRELLRKNLRDMYGLLGFFGDGGEIRATPLHILVAEFYRFMRCALRLDYPAGLFRGGWGGVTLAASQIRRQAARAAAPTRVRNAASARRRCDRFAAGSATCWG